MTKGGISSVSTHFSKFPCCRRTCDQDHMPRLRHFGAREDLAPTLPNHRAHAASQVSLDQAGSSCLLTFHWPSYSILFILWIYDIWYMIYDIWYMIYDIRYLISDTWYMIYGIWYIHIYIYICWLLFNSPRFSEVQRTSELVENSKAMTGKETNLQPAALKFNKWVCLKIVYPYTQWLMIIIPTKWL